MFTIFKRTNRRSVAFIENLLIKSERSTSINFLIFHRSNCGIFLFLNRRLHVSFGNIKTRHYERYFVRISRRHSVAPVAVAGILITTLSFVNVHP